MSPCDVISRNARRKILGTAHAQYDRRGNAPNLNDPRPLPGSFELGGLAPEDLRYAAATLQASALSIKLARKTCGGVA